MTVESVEQLQFLAKKLGLGLCDCLNDLLLPSSQINGRSVELVVFRFLPCLPFTLVNSLLWTFKIRI